MGLQGRRSLSPSVSPYRVPVFSCAHYFQAPITQAIQVLIHIYKAILTYMYVRAYRISVHNFVQIRDFLFRDFEFLRLVQGG